MTEIREALNSAIEQHSEGGAANDNREPASPPAANDAPAGGSGVEQGGKDLPVAAEGGAKAATEARARDASGKFVKAANDNAEKAAPPQVTAGSNTGSPSAGAPAAAPQPGAAPASPEPLKAPQSWTAMEREVWKGMTPEAQKAVLRREAEIARGLQEAAPAKQFHQGFHASPAAVALRGQGLDPGAVASDALQFVANMRTAQPLQRAQMVWQLAAAYGVTEDHLVAVRDGQPAPAQSQAQPYDPRFDAFMQQLQMAQAQRQQAEQQKREREWADFAAKHEFFDDVREDVQDALDVAQRRGRALTLEDAYNKAVRAHPEISEVLKQREAAKQANANTASTQRARAASSSVRSQPTAPVAQSEGDLEIRNLLRSQLNGTGQ